jgi:serine/threonine protein kinase
MFQKLYGLISSKRYTIGTYTVELQEQISEGGFAYIYKAKDVNTNQLYAVKKMLVQVYSLLERKARASHQRRAVDMGTLITSLN